MTTLIGAITSAVQTSAEWAVSGKSYTPGNRRTDHNGAEWVYVQASASLTIYDAVAIKADYKALQLTLDGAKSAVEVGFAQVAFDVGDRGWVQVTGRPLIRLAADCEPSLALYATATGGVLDDATTSAMIQGVVATTSVTGATTAATCVSSFPTLARAVVLGAV